MERTIFDTVADQPVAGQEKKSLMDTVIYPEQTKQKDLLNGIVMGKETLITENPLPAGRFGVGDSRHDWGIHDEQLTSLQDIRAAHQSSGEQFLAFANQAVVGNVIGGGIEGAGYLLDIEQHANMIAGTEKEFGNWFSDIGKKLNTWSQETTPIYQDSRQGKFAPNHWSWWMQNGTSVASTLSLMIPAAGAFKGITSIAKLLGGWQRLTPVAKWATTGLGQAALSRHMESMQEASGVYKEAYTNGKTKGMSDADAKEYGARAASKDYNLNWAMYLQDVPQYLLLNTAFGKATVGAAEKSLLASVKMGKNMVPIISKKGAAILADMGGEGFEEGYQWIVSQESQYLTDKLRNPKDNTSFDQRLRKYTKDGEFWTNVSMGALGAGVMQTAGKAINDLIQGGDPQTRFVKDFGAKIAQASQGVKFADIMGSESGKRAAITNLEKTLFTHAASTGSMDDAKELIKRTADANDPLVQSLGVKPEDLETLKLNHEEILKHADQFEKLWEKNMKLHDANKAADITNAEFIIDSFNEHKKQYRAKLDELKPQITNYNNLSEDARQIFGISSEIVANQKGIDFQQNRINNTTNPLSTKEKELAQKLIDVTEKSNSRLKADLLSIDKQRDPITRKQDNELNIGGFYNLLDSYESKKAALELEQKTELNKWDNHYRDKNEAYIKMEKENPEEFRNSGAMASSAILMDEQLETSKNIKAEYAKKIDELPKGKTISNHSILEHMKVSDALTFADQTLKSAQEYLATILAEKQPVKPEPIPDEDLIHVPESDDYVLFTKDGKEYPGIVDYMNADGDYVIIPTTKWSEDSKYASKPTGDPIIVSKNKVLLDNKQYTEEDIVDESLSDEDGAVQPQVDEVTSEKYLDVAYMHDNGGPVPVVDNEDLHKFLINPKTSLDGVTAEMYIDTNTEYSLNLLKEAGLLPLEIRRIKNGKLTDNDINALQARLGGFDIIPISIRLVKDGKVLHSKGMYYHTTNFIGRGVPSFIESQGTEAVNRYLNNQKQRIRTNRFNIVPNLLRGNEVYSDTLRITNGRYNNGITKGNILERHGLELSDGRLAVSRKNGKIYKSNTNIIAGVTAGTAGNIFAPTKKTINGKEAWAKVSPTKITVEHAEILWDAIKTRYSKGNGMLAEFPDARVEGLNVGEVIKMITLFGEKKTNLDYENKKTGDKFQGEKREDLRKKTFYVHHEAGVTQLVFGKTTIDLFEDNINGDSANKKVFIKWVTENKNYSIPLAIKSLGIDLNAPFKRTFKIGLWENKADDKGNFMTTAQFLMSVPVDGKQQFAVVSDLQEYEGTGSAFVRPNLMLGDNNNAIKIRQRQDNKPKVPKETTKSKMRKEASKKRSKGPISVDSPFDIKDLPVGAELYYNDPIVEDGIITDKFRQRMIVSVQFDNKLGRVLNLTRLQTNEISTKFGQWLMLDHPDSFKQVDEFVSALKRLRGIDKVFIDLSEVVGEKTEPATSTEEIKPEVKTEVKETAPIVPPSNETVDDLEDLLGMKVPMTANFSETVKSVIDIPKELKWLHDKFGVQNTKLSDKLLTIASDGRKAFSVFTSDCIYIYTGAPEGAVYHEAFHRVILGYLNVSDRQQIFESARKQFNLPNANDNEISEKLAESFRQYKLNGIKPKSRTIWQFFSDIYQFIRTVFTGKTRLTSYEIDRLYDSINRGQYRYSKITQENLKILNGIETPMAVEIRKTPISFINNYHDLDKIVKFLTGILIQTNGIDNLNDIKNIKMSNMWNHVDTMVTKLSNMISNTQKQLDDNLIADDKIVDTKGRLQVSINLLNLLNSVKSKEFSQLFVDKISDMLTKLNVKRIEDEDAELENITNNNYKTYYDRASYEVNSKDNILASVKFLIATLPKNGQLDPNIGISEFVDFNEMWNSLMHNLYDISDVDEMMDRLAEHSEKYPYEVLISKLNADLTGDKKQQLRAAVQKHRHNFVNFLLTLGKEGLPPKIAITNADVSRASVMSIKEWNYRFYGSKLLNITNTEVIPNETLIKTIWEDFDKFQKKVEKEYSATKVFADKKGIISTLVSLLNRIGITVDELAVEELVKNRVADNDADALLQIVVADMSRIFEKVKNITSKDAMRIFNDERHIRILAEADANTHPEKISDIVLGPSNNQYYVYSQNSHVTDIIRRIRNNRDYLEEHLQKVYNDNSYFGQQMLDDDNVRKGIEIMTFAMFGQRGTAGEDYLGVNPIEDYIFKLSAMAKGYIPFPTMADRKTYYLLKGLQTFKFEYKPNGTGGYIIPEEAVNIILGYAKSEHNRIVQAEKTIKEYLNAVESGNEERIKELGKNLVENYHYKIKSGKKLFDKDNAMALLYHNFPSFNREGFDFDSMARDEIKTSFTKNVSEELAYLEELGVVGSTLDTSTNKRNYYNRLIPSAADNSAVDLLKEGIEKYGTTSMAIKNLVASHTLNTIIANNEVEKLFSGDPAFFKQDKDTKRVTEDKIKRLSVLTSSGDNFADTVKEDNLLDGDFNIATVTTQKFKSVYYEQLEKWHVDRQLKDLKISDPTIDSTEVLVKAKALVHDALKAYREIDSTDGQAWISPDMYRSLSKRLGEWSDEKQVAFDLMKLDRELTPEEEKLTLNVTFQPLKLVYFSLLHDGNLAIPTFHKASFATIFRTMTVGKYGNRQISSVLDRMERTGVYANDKLERVDIFVSDSATKVGNRAKFNMFDDKMEQLNDLSNIDVYKQPFNGLRRQLVTDAHDVDRTKTGTQFLKIVLGNLNLNDQVYNFNNKSVDGKFIRDAAFKSLTALSNRGRQQLEEKLGYKDGRIDKKKLVELLQEDAKKSNASDNLVDAIMMMGDDMYLEIDALTDRKWIQSRIISLISKYTVDVNLPGNQLIQFSNYGMRSIDVSYTAEKEASDTDKHISWIKEGTDDLKWARVENGSVVGMSCLVSINLFKHIIPNYKDITYKEKVQYLKDNPEIMGYRIPTQGQNSVFMLSVAGVYPETIGDTITLPSEFTALTGSDFDIDKVFVVRHNYYVDEQDKSFEKIKFLEGDTNDPKFLTRLYNDRYGKILRKWRHLKGYNLEKQSSIFDPHETEVLTQILESSDDDKITSLVEKLLKYGRVTQYWNEINDILEHYNLDTFKEENKGKDLYEVNSRKAVENRLIDTFFSVMRSEEHFNLTSIPLGDLTDRLKKKAQKIRQASDKVRPDMYYQSPRFNEDVKFTYTGGKNGIGPFALNNVHHVLAQLAGLQMKGSLGDVLYKTDKGIDLSQHKGKDGVYISNWLSALIDAHVDVAKDPYIMDLNVNSFTYNVVALLIRGGAGETAFDFLAQPILKDIAHESILSDKTSTLKKTLRIQDGLDDENQPKYKYAKNAIDFVKNKWQKDFTKEELDEISKTSVSDAFGKDLNPDLFNQDITNKDYIKRQLIVLKAFEEILKMGTDLNTLVQASQIDTKKFGSNITELRVFLNKIRKAYETKAFINIEKILPFDPETGQAITGPDVNFLGTYAANAIKFSLDVMGEISIYGTPVFEQLFNKLVTISSNEFTIDSKFVNVLSDEIFTAIVSKYFTDPNGDIKINSAGLAILLGATTDYRGGVPRKLYNLKDDTKFADLKDNMFLKYLYLAPTSDEIIETILPMFVTVPMKSVKDKMDKDNMISSFKELLKDNRKEVSDLARQLYYYAFFTSGYRSRIYSFFNMLPNEMGTELKVKDPTDPNGYIILNGNKSYNGFIKKTLNEMKNIMNYVTYNSIVDEVLINNHDHDNIVKQIDDRNIEQIIPNYKDKKSDSLAGLIIKPEASKYLHLGFNEDKQWIFRPWIKVQDPTVGHILMRYIGYLIQNIETKTIVKPVYVTQNMRSYNSRGIVIKEYGMDKSLIPAYNELKVVFKFEEEDFLKTLISEGITYTYVPSEEQLIINSQLEILEDETSMIETLRNNTVYISKVGSGGQLGVDMAGLDAAIESGISIGGTASAGYVQSPADKTKLVNLELRDKYGLKEGTTRKRTGQYGEYDDIYHDRTIANAQEFDATLWFGTETSPGGKLTLGKEAQKNKPPVLVNPTNVDEIIQWLKKYNIHTLNIAGNREWTNPGIYESSKQMLLELFKTINTLQNETGNIAEMQNEGKREGQIVIPTQLSLFGELTDNIKDTIYDKLGNKTVSGNVRIESWNSLKDIIKPYTKVDNTIIHIISTRTKESPDDILKGEHFGNPFSSVKSVLQKDSRLIITSSVRESVEKYIDWVINSQDERAKWIREQIQSGDLQNKPILYYKELGEPSHATALDYLINKYDWTSIDEFPFLTNTPDVIFSTEPKAVSDLVNKMGIINWEKVTPEEWKELRDTYKHCTL